MFAGFSQTGGPYQITVLQSFQLSFLHYFWWKSKFCAEIAFSPYTKKWVEPIFRIRICPHLHISTRQISEIVFSEFRKLRILTIQYATIQGVYFGCGHRDLSYFVVSLSSVDSVDFKLNLPGSHLCVLLHSFDICLGIRLSVPLTFLSYSSVWPSQIY